MTNTMIYRKKAAKRIEQALPAGQTLRYQNLGHDNILSAYLPGFMKDNSPQQRQALRLEMDAIISSECVEDGSMDYDYGSASITIIFK